MNAKAFVPFLLAYVAVSNIFLGWLWLRFWHFTSRSHVMKMLGLYAYFSVFFFCLLEIRRVAGRESVVGKIIVMSAVFMLLIVLIKEYRVSKSKAIDEAK